MSKLDDFFVGYLPISKQLSGFYKVFIVLIMLLGIASAVWIAGSQQSPGEGSVDLSNQQQLSGYLTIDPYPVLHQVGSDNRSVIIVEPTKKSADELLQSYKNQWVTLSGFPVNRGGWSMLQVPPGSEITVSTSKQKVNIVDQDLGEVTFEGEIIDSKCFLGAMKPGGGKVHRACAWLCLLGGIPPMLVIKDQQDQRIGYLLMNSKGESASIEFAELVAVPVKVSGRLIQRGDLQYISINSSDITKLTGHSLHSYGETLAEATLNETLAGHSH